MNPSQKRVILDGSGCEARFDDLTRQMYATDASIYQIEPFGVAFPKGPAQAQRLFRAAIEADVALIPRGAGTGLAGAAVGSGLIVDFSRYNRGISGFAREQRTIRVEPGVVLDQLNAYLKPHGLWFGPDVATSSRATLGGMIANNSSGAHVPVYGTTADHVRSLNIVLSDGRRATIGKGHDALPELRRAVEAIARENTGAIRERFTADLLKRWPGYGLDDYLNALDDVTKLIGGSEGTLAAIVSAELNLVPLPEKKGLALFFFDSVMEAMRATVAFLDLEPAAIEHIDDVLYDQTIGQNSFAPTRALLELDAAPCKSILMVEFYDNCEDKLAAAARRNVGKRHMILSDAAEQEMVWALRKAGLSLLTGRAGAPKPIPGIEDVAVEPHKLPDYVEGLQAIMDRLGLEGSFYGHAAAGLLHVRPVIDLHKAEDIARYRKLAEETFALVKTFKGSIAAEHGVGIARTEFLEEHIGPELMAAMTAIKKAFDPENRMNPGKIVSDRSYRLDADLRWGAGYEIPLPFQPITHFHKKNEPFVGTLEQCNGCGGCRKDAPSMCPTFIATGDELMSTRGRANIIRAVLDGRLHDNDEPLLSPALDAALSNCISCKACETECPSNVNMALLKAQLLHAKHQKHGLTLRNRMIADVDVTGRWGSLAPGVANFIQKSKPGQNLLRHYGGFTRKRPLPMLAKTRFDRAFYRRKRMANGSKGRVILWDDTFVRYYEPNIGHAAVKVLEAAGYEVVLAEGRECCGRPAFSAGVLDKARACGEHNVALLQKTNAPIIFLEPSCYSMFIEDYANLGIDGAPELARRCVLFETFLLRALEGDASLLEFRPGYHWVAIHGHCHQKALESPGNGAKLARFLPNSTVTLLNTGCCGMAGAFGQLEEKYELSVKIAKPLVKQIGALQAGTEVVACGTSCRHQIDHLTEVRPIHMAELIASAIV